MRLRLGIATRIHTCPVLPHMLSSPSQIEWIGGRHHGNPQLLRDVVHATKHSARGVGGAQRERRPPLAGDRPLGRGVTTPSLRSDPLTSTPPGFSFTSCTCQHVLWDNPLDTRSWA